MKGLSLSVSIVVAALAWAQAPVAAADLDYRGVPPPDRYGSAYDDPRYRDLYGPEPTRSYTYAPEPYRSRTESFYDTPHSAPVPPGYVYRRRHADAPHGYDDRADRACLPRRVIERRLFDEGWRDFHHAKALGDVARVKARRENGDLFVLKVDRCSGEIVKARLIERYENRPYAFREPTERYERRYY